MRTNDLGVAASIFESQERVLEKVDEMEYNLYTEYKRTFPHFRSCTNSDFYVVLFSDQHCNLDPLTKNIVLHQDHYKAIGYSQEILDCFSPDQITTLPLPQFAPLFMGFCRTYIETKEVTAAMAAEALVDGTNLDEEWCRARFPTDQSDELKFALRLVRGKSSRIADFSPNEVTCFIADREGAERMRKVPGFS